MIISAFASGSSRNLGQSAGAASMGCRWDQFEALEFSACAPKAASSDNVGI